MVDRTRALSVHKFRRRARREERRLTDAMRRVALEPTDWDARHTLAVARVPEWARGVRVEPIGPWQHAVVATEHAGH